MAYEVNYNGVDLHEYFDILKVTKRVLPKRTNFAKDIPSRHGLVYLNYKYEPKEITLECLIHADDNLELTNTMEYIAYVLDVANPSKLIISDDPFKYYMAVVSETDDIEQVRFNGKFNLTFICYDPIAYGLEPVLFNADAKKIVTVANPGTTNAYPKVNIEFSNTAHFLQCTNYDGKTVLVGTPPDVQKPTAPFSPIVFDDSCETLEGWTTVSSSSLDKDREAGGSIQVNGGGYGLTYGNLGSGTNGWHGGAMRKNLTQPTDQFEIIVKMEHNSKGDVRGQGAGQNPPPSPPPSDGGGTTPATVDYRITAEPSLRIREGRGTHTRQIGSIKRNTVVGISEIDKGWGKVTYNGVTGYCSMDYCVLAANSVPSSGGQYKITSRKGVNIRSGRGTNYKKLTAIPYGKVVSVNDIDKGWGRVSYNGKTGYMAMQYCSPVNNSRSKYLMPFAEGETPSAENRIGLIEVYGYDSYGAKLFKMKLYDSDKYYEATRPEIEIGSNLVLQDNNKVPAPKTITETNEDKTSTTKPVDSGKFGDWNEFVGNFRIKRVKNSNGNYEWQCSVDKLGENNIVSKTISTSTLVDSRFPKTELSNIVIYFAQFNSEEIVDVMNISNIYIKNLQDPPKPEENKPLFKQGDILLLDFESEKVYKNTDLFMNELDIGSQFFSCPVGNSQFICNSDDQNIDIITSIQTRWV